MRKYGLSSFKDHPALFLHEKSTLFDYASHLSLIELDSIYYGIPQVSTVENWQQQVPKDFTFIVKAYAGMTGQSDFRKFFVSEKAMFDAFKISFTPLLKREQLAAVLFQFPAEFYFSKEALAQLKIIRKYLTDWPLSVEFRHGSWWAKENLATTENVLKQLQISLLALDEPQIITNPVPFYITKTTENLFVRLHGRNLTGWLSGQKGQRTLYNYSQAELLNLTMQIQEVAADFKNIFVIFNNNAGGHAAQNLASFEQIWPQDALKLNPQQLKLF
ncbi:DUF72 domain-containing protein [Enterococcus timonensis]|uniref:DUF72 domain-containing protein n=1 Tax=Enterococcus timonensis TaxID=1852364 RepID=UPI0008DA7BF7|nr:DUF72 domain-containing protein [Enterococcus timonensis]